MKILGLDLGKRRTGVSFVDTTIGVPLVLDTLVVDSEADLVSQILQLCDERQIDLVVVGLPLLLSGGEGMQSAHVRLIGDRLEQGGIEVEYLDERYTTQKNGETDGDARAACELLRLFLDRQR